MMSDIKCEPDFKDDFMSEAVVEVMESDVTDQRKQEDMIKNKVSY